MRFESGLLSVGSPREAMLCFRDGLAAVQKTAKNQNRLKMRKDYFPEILEFGSVR